MSADPVLGMYRSTVANNQDPLNEARVTLLIPQVLGNAESAWALPSTPTNTVPGVDQTVWVQFSGGDITKPVYSPLGLQDVQEQVDDINNGSQLNGMPPKEPTGLTLSTVQYVNDEGATLARVTVYWTPPTENQDGTNLTDLDHYVIQFSYDGSEWSGGYVTTEDLVVFDGLHTGADCTVRVQAVDTANNASLWAAASITTASASTPPPVPSAPAVMGRLAGLRVTWDGKDASGFAMPAIFSHAQVQRDVTPEFTNPVVVGTMPTADLLYDPVQNYANAYYYRLVAYSKVGIASAPSASNSGTAQQVLDQDILDGALTAAKIAVGAIDKDKLAKDAVTADAIANGAVEAGKLAALAVGTINIANNAVTGAQIADATIGSAKIINAAIDTAQIADAAINNAKIANLDAGKINTGTLNAARIATGSLDASVIKAATLTAAQVQVGSLTGDLLAANTITANKVAANTLTAGQMAVGTITAESGVVGSLDADKITVGTLSAARLSVGVSGSINQKFYDGMAEASKWKATTGTPTSVAVSDAYVGGYITRAVGGTGSFYRTDVKIPFDPGALYRITAVVRQTVSNSTPGTNQGFYAGLVGWAADGTTMVNRDGANSFSSQNYSAASNAGQTTGAGWTRYTGYIKGWAAAGTSGTGGASNNPNSPGTLHANIRYISPLMYLNYTGGTGTQEVGLFTVEVVETGSVGTVNIQDGAISAPKIAAGSITADKLDANAINGKTITGATVQTAASGQRVVLNSSNLQAIGANGATIGVDPNSNYPTIYFTSKDLTNRAVINVTGKDSDADIGINSGTFVDSSDGVAYKWRTFFGNDFYTAERVNGVGTANGARLYMSKNSASLSAGVNGSMVIEGSAGIRAQGVLRADNVSKGKVTINPVPNSPTSVTLSGGNIAGSTFYGFATVNSAYPGTIVTGVGCTAVTKSGMTVWVTRTNDTATTVYWMIVGED